MTVQRISQRQAVVAIADREDFAASALTGRHGSIGAGRLPEPFRTEFLAAEREHGAALYVVYSYATPIAWAGPSEALTIPDARYSVTTSGKHQPAARHSTIPALVDAARNRNR